MEFKSISTEDEVLIASPFARLRELLSGLEPGNEPIDMSLGEPRHPMPDFVQSVIDQEIQGFGKYPPISGTADLREAIASWLNKRYSNLDGVIEPEVHILPLNGSREGLFSAVFTAIERKRLNMRPAVLMPNPFYQCYVAGALSAGAEPIFLNATSDTDYLPALDDLDEALLARTAVMYLCSPSNPQGRIANEAYLVKALSLAREYNFLLFSDECYSEIYFDHPPPGALDISQKTFGDLKNVVVFNSLSKRSNLPGLRSGFIAGDPDFISDYLQFRNVACPQVPLPIQHVSAAVWRDEVHVRDSRKLYINKFEAADSILESHFGYRRPDGAFFLWLNMQKIGGGECATATLWKGCGVKMIPGAYLAKQCEQGINPGHDYVRIAMVQDLETSQEALRRIVEFVD